ncbi:hypothetical protein RJT34_26659 [Clitoria ternatea]|uniref:Secreted protein n=1 Tax=Clitoria ternatea TaxID=43366 RepID=A0AAN9IFW9_CLITE
MNLDLSWWRWSPSRILLLNFSLPRCRASLSRTLSSPAAHDEPTLVSGLSSVGSFSRIQRNQAVLQSDLFYAVSSAIQPIPCSSI